MNESRTCTSSDTPLTQRRSRPVLYEIVGADGVAKPAGFTTASAAFQYARRLWPDQEQDPERTGKGWDVQGVGAGNG